MATILDRLVEEHQDVEGINDARNIAEAVAMIKGIGGRGANAIKDQIPFANETVEEEVVEETANP